MKYEIRDWMNAVLFNGTEFDSFEDAWDYIYENCNDPEFEDDGEFDDYYVIPTNYGGI